MSGFALIGITRPEWGAIAAAELPRLLADHATCEQQAAINALGLIGTYGDDAVLVEKLGALAQEEIIHFRKVVALLKSRGLPVVAFRRNPYATALRKLVRGGSEPSQYIDRMLISALIEARSAERFTRLAESLADPEAKAMVEEFSPAEERHFELFLELAARRTDEPTMRSRWNELSLAEGQINAGLGREARIHG